jgi:hypothetical protein
LISPVGIIPDDRYTHRRSAVEFEHDPQSPEHSGNRPPDGRGTRGVDPRSRAPRPEAYASGR